MDNLWPLSLQQLLSEANFGEEEGDTLLRSENDVGPAKVRRRYTKGVDKLTGSIDLTVAQYSQFKDFYKTTLNGGSLPFLFDHPITKVQTRYRFIQAPRYSSIGGGNFTVSFSWEALP